MSAKISSRQGEGRVLEEDLILYSNLRLLGFEDALQKWPELTKAKLNFTQNMFWAPNRAAVETILYFIGSLLLSRDLIKKEFRDIWPPKNVGQSREFRSRIIQKIKEYSKEWEISKESLNVLTAVLQRNAGQKLVRLFCELSYSALKSTLPSDLESPMEIPQPDELSDRLMEARIRVGKAKIQRHQQRFLQLVVDSQQHQEEVLLAASKIISKYNDLVQELETLRSQHSAYQPQFPDGVSPSMEAVAKLMSSWSGMESVLREVEEMGSLMKMLMQNPKHPYAISGQKLLTLMSQSAAENSSEMAPRRTTMESEFCFAETEGTTEVDLLSMTKSWVHCDIQELLTLFEKLLNKSAGSQFVKDLLFDASLPDLMIQSRDEQQRNIEELKKMKQELMEDIGKLDSELESGKSVVDHTISEAEFAAPSILSSLLE